MKLKNRVALVTGSAGKGMGRSIALTLAREGAKVVINYRKSKDQAWRNGVTVNIIGPGPAAAIESLNEAIEQCNHGPAWHKRSNTSPQDIAESAAFLCSDAGRFITGCTLPFLFH